MFKSVESYYSFHSRIYDLTRWSILFGRNDLLTLLPKGFKAKRILDIGCGTGIHLKQLSAQFPDSEISGVDQSPEMIAKAKSKISQAENINLVQTDWESFLNKSELYDLIICSYSLTLAKNPNQIVHRITNSLTQNGILLVVDFKFTPFALFQKWMRLNHVNISGEIFEILDSEFPSHVSRTKRAWFGLWEFFMLSAKK